MERGRREGKRERWEGRERWERVKEREREIKKGGQKNMKMSRDGRWMERKFEDRNRRRTKKIETVG